MNVIKKDSHCVPFDFEKIRAAVGKSADRVNVALSEGDMDEIKRIVVGELEGLNQPAVDVQTVHASVEKALDKVSPEVAKAYRDYRNYKREFVRMMDSVLKTADEANYKVDRSNANTSSALVSTKRSLIYSALNKEIYRKTFLNHAEISAVDDGYIYVHDIASRLDTANCFARETEFMTTDGLRSFADFNDGDVITVFDAFGHVQQATVHNYGKQQLNKVVLKRCSKGYQTVYVTANHRWLLKNGKETTNLKVGDKLMLAPSVHFKTAEEMTPKEAFAWSCGFILADGATEHYKSKHGDCDRDCSKVRLCGQKKKFAPIFIKAGLNVTYPKSLNGDGFVYCRNFVKKNFNREEMNKYSLDELKMMAQGYMSADGHLSLGLRPMGHFRGVQASGSHNDWLLDLLSIGGFYVTSEENLTGRQTNYGERKFTIKYQLHDNQGCRGYVVQSIESAYEDEVWCLDVQNSHSFLLRGGIPTGNCCLFDMGKVLQGGFEWEHIGYNEPKDVRTAGNLISDITLNCAAQQYGGFTIPEIDSIMAPYAEKSYNRYVREYKSLCEQMNGNYDEHAADQYAIKKVERDIEQVFQGFEHTFNTVASSRGDYPFITITGGCDETRFGTLVWATALKVRREGQGHPGHKRPAIFPKMVFLYTKELHGEGKPLEWLFNEGVKTSCAAMYPDWLSLDEPDETLIKGVHAPHYEPQIANVFKKYHKFGVSRWYLDKNENVQENPEWVDAIISPMGKRKLQPISNFLNPARGCGNISYC